jgi:anti-sigma B factor antagonist
MKIQLNASTILVSELTELNGPNAGTFRDAARAAITDAITTVDVDLSLTRFLDSSGLGALIALQKTLAARRGNVRILNPSATAQQILELTRLHRVFEIVRT